MVGYIPAIPRTRLQRLPEFIERVQQSHFPPGPGENGPRAMLQYDPRVGDLRPFYWPTDGEERVTPDKLGLHRSTHWFLGPCCLCPWLDGSSSHVEAKIGLAQMVMDGEHAAEYLGQYVAMCAEQRCGYFVIVEHFFTHFSLPVKEYPKRAEPLKVADPFLFMTDDTEETAARSGLRQIIILGENDNNGLRGSRKCEYER
ncbi:hypothetical protein NMY22_g10764 [Coprinellus aureogranulatus]|nr:hypothetical protein NMY22_g10764 [Coprinellus aureogranulatus]